MNVGDWMVEWPWFLIRLNLYGLISLELESWLIATFVAEV